MNNDENAQFDESVDVDNAQENVNAAEATDTPDETTEQILTVDDLVGSDLNDSLAEETADGTDDSADSSTNATELPEIQVEPEGPIVDEAEAGKDSETPEIQVEPEGPLIDAEGYDTAETVEGDDAAQTVEGDDAGDADDDTDDDDADESRDGDGEGFTGLSLPSNVLAAVERVGFENPSPIQEQTIPLLMEGRDVVGLAQTGTGKTAAFALPILSRINKDERHPQALVLAPTRELALQVADSFQSFADHLGNISILPIYGGQAYGVQLSGLRRGAQIIVGTPGRVIDHLERGSLDISNLRFLVLDEADEMLNMGFQEDVERILEDTPDEKQVALFSATMPNAIRRISKQYLDDPAEVTVKSETRTNTNISQRYLFTPGRNKMDALTRVLEVAEFEAMIIFVRTKNDTEEVAQNLREQGFAAAAINGDIPQQQRERTVDQLRDGRIDILVATDVAARGLDVERISHVLNYDIPRDTESYVHRIGRTGRAGRSGKALLFVTPRERRMLRSIEKVTGARIEEVDLPTVDQVNDARKAKFADSITASLDAKQIDLFKELVQNYSEANGVAMEDIAAALAAQAQGEAEFLMKEQPKSKKDRRDREKWDREDRFDRDRGDRGGRGKRDRFDRDDRGDRGGRKFDRQQDSENFDTYRLDVGKRQHVRPGGIVGALANEGGLTNKDFGRITIGGDFSLVELPKNLDPAVLDRLSDTRISGQLINIKRDTGAPSRDRGGYRDRGYRDRDDDRRGGYRDRGYRDRDDRDNRGGRGGHGGFRGRDDDRRGGYRDRDDDHRGGYRGGRDRDWDSRDRGRNKKKGWRD